MKRKIFALALAAVLLLCAAPSASAEEISKYNLGSFTVGEEMNCYIADISSDSDPISNDLPDGCKLEKKTSNGVTKLYLTGTPQSTGTKNFTVTIGSSKLSYTIEVELAPLVTNAETPRISASSDVTVKLGATTEISVTASVSDGGTLSYQWYYSDGSRVPDASSSRYSPNTFLTGSTGYYCIVTNTNGTSSASVQSKTIYVTVIGDTPQTISVKTMPSKTSYTLGESLNTSGLTLTADYGGGYTETVTSGFTVSPTTLSTAGTQRITVSYKGLSCSFDVTVQNKEATVEGIGVLYLPDKTLYKVGDTLDTEGLVIRAYTSNGTVDVSADDLECSPTTLSTAGSQTITVTYGGKTCSFKVTVEEDSTTVSISVSSLPTKTEYTVGESLDTSGLVIRVLKKHGTEEIKTGFTCSPKTLSTAGKQTVTVSYDGKTCSFTVTVSEKTASPSPSASASATPAPSASASATPVASYTPVPHESHQSSFGATLAKVILVIALLALVGLGAYVYIVRRKGKK